MNPLAQLSAHLRDQILLHKIDSPLNPTFQSRDVRVAMTLDHPRHPDRLEEHLDTAHS